MKKNVIECLRERGFIDAITSEELVGRANSPLKVYAGFDPTANSLHLGNLVGIIALGWFQKFGHTPVVILGGATGRIGDPSGKSTERPLLSDEELEVNIAGIRKHFEAVLDFFRPNCRALLFDNNSWFGSIKFVDFLRDVGKHFRVNQMLTKESVRARLDSEEGISFTEFSYQLLQAYDFYHLHKTHSVALQMGGSDQWGNITAGIELIRKLSRESAFGLTWPLITRSDGKKFGKTEEGAIWLSPERCSPYQFYQYLFRMPDADVPKLMRMLTYMEMEEIREIEAEMERSGYVPNTAQKRLASELTKLIHGEEGLEAALRATEGAMPGAKAELNAETLREIAKDMPNADLSSSAVLEQKYVDLVVATGLLASKGEATRLIAGGGAYLNDEKVEDVQLRIGKHHLIGGEYLLLGIGKKKKMVVRVKNT